MTTLDNPITLQQAVDYEIAGAWWSGYVSNKTAHYWLAKYFIWKAKRKFRRYQRSVQLRAILRGYRMV